MNKLMIEWMKHMQKSKLLYLKLVDNKLKKER